MANRLFQGTALILAGGKSSRLGFDKQMMACNGNYLVDDLIALLGGIFEEVLVVSNRPELYHERTCRVVEDVLKDCGPLGGLYSGLSAAAFDVCYLTACDMPWIQSPYIRYLLERKNANPESEAIVTRYGEMIEPMNAIYCRCLADRVAGKLQNGQRRMTDLLNVSDTLYIPEKTARCYSRNWDMFDNINTVADFLRWKMNETGCAVHDSVGGDKTMGER